MRVTKTLAITSQGALNITLSLSKSSIYVGNAVTLTMNWAVDGVGGGTSDVTIAWGDGTTPETLSNVTPPQTKNHTFTSAGSFTIAVSVNDKTHGVINSKTISIQVNAVLAATLSVDKSTGAIPLAVVFTVGISGGYTPYSWSLDFGDGTTPATEATAGTVNHTYMLVGSFTATLTVTDAHGATALFTLEGIRLGLQDWWTARTNAEKALVICSLAGSVIAGVFGIQRLRKRR